ncbi:hypothetical protein Tco_0328183 [Tanacetum coccineum]
MDIVASHLQLVEFRKRAWSIIAWMDSGVMLFGLVLLTGTTVSSLKACLTQHAASESESHVPDVVSKAPDELPDSILSSEPKPLRKHRPPPPPSILSPGESSYPPLKSYVTLVLTLPRSSGAISGTASGSAVDNLPDLVSEARHPDDGSKGDECVGGGDECAVGPCS